jgi:DNA-binding response OmpR family regulator
MRRVCVVDDDHSVLHMLGRTLKDSGLDVDVLDRGMKLLHTADVRRYDLILLDLGLPDVDGVTVLQKLREGHPEIQVMMVSAHDDCANRVRCLDFGACDFVGKPFDLPELLARVRARLRHSSSENESRYLVGGEARLDQVRHCLLLADRRVPLPPREFLLLRYLMTKVGEVCTREELMASVWGYNFEADGNVVDVYVSRLRHKLPPAMIETVRHVGYCFACA